MIKYIKALLKKMFPPSRQYFNRRMESADTNLETLTKRIIELGKKVDNINKQTEGTSKQVDNINKQTEGISKQVDNINKQTEGTSKQVVDYGKKLETVAALLGQVEKDENEIKRLIKSNGNGISDIKRYMRRKVLYNNDHERKVIGSFYDYYNRIDFKEKFLALISHLDVRSVETVVRILKRQQMIKDTEGEKLDILTNEEQERRIKIKEEFDYEKFKIADDLYCYKNYLLPINHFEISVFVDKHGIDLVDDIHKTYDRDIIDVGGYIGDSILILSPLTRKRVYSFEAVSECFEYMQKTIEINNINNAVPIKMALGARDEVIDINVADSVSSFCVPLAGEVGIKESVKVITLDDYVEKNALDIGMIKVDIEGFEQEFLKGAEKTIKKHKPILLLSIYHNADDFFNIKPLIESWDIGYKFKIHKPKDLSISREVLLIAEI